MEGLGFSEDELAAVPLEKRVCLFERARHIAADHGIETHVCGCMNPDLTDELCALAGEWPAQEDRDTQTALFNE